MTWNLKRIKSNEFEEVKDNGRRIVGSNGRLSVSNHKDNFLHIILLIEVRSLNYSLSIFTVNPSPLPCSLSICQFPLTLPLSYVSFSLFCHKNIQHPINRTLFVESEIFSNMKLWRWFHELCLITNARLHLVWSIFAVLLLSNKYEQLWHKKNMHVTISLITLN